MKRAAIVATALIASASAAAAQNADGTWLGTTTSTVGQCIASSYALVLSIEGESFRATIRRVGGSRNGSTFEITGTVDAENRLQGTMLGGVRTSGFSGEVSGDRLTGSSARTTCRWSFTLTRRDCAPFTHDELLLEGFTEEDLDKFCT